MLTSPPISIHHLYRQRFPAAAPQAVQILATCHGLARAGAKVHLLADRPLPVVEELSAAELLRAHGLEVDHRLRIEWLSSRHRTLAGLEYRARFLHALRSAVDRGTAPVVFSRRVEYAADFIRWRTRLALPIALVFEWHYLASANANEAGESHRARKLEQAEAMVLAHAEGHVAVSRAMRDFLREGFKPAGPIEVIPNGGPPVASREWKDFSGDDERLGVGNRGALPTGERQRLSIDSHGFGARSQPSRPTVIYAGLFRRPEDFNLLLEAVPHFPPDVETLVIGGDESGRVLERVRQRAKSTGVADRIQFLGPQTPIGVRAELARADVAIATFADTADRRNFGCPLKILEYHAAGVPLVSTDHPTLRELVEDKRSGLLVPHDDPAALAAAVSRLLENPALAATLAEEGLRLAGERTWARRGERLLTFFESDVLPRSLRSRGLGGSAGGYSVRG